MTAGTSTARRIEEERCIRTFRYRLYPTKAQVAALDFQLSEACALYNAALEERRGAWKIARKSVSFYDQDRQLKEIRAAGNTGIVSFDVARGVLRRVDRAFDGFFRRVKAGDKPGYPRFKPWRRYDSITFPRADAGWRLLDSRHLRIKGVGVLKLRLHRPIPGSIKIATIKREAGRWFALFVVECKIEPLPPSLDAIGLDVGLTSFAVLSDGSVIENPRCERTNAAKIRRARRKVARCRRGGNGRRQAIQNLSRATGRVERQRTDFHHKVARSIVNRYGLIAVEDLNIKGLAASRLSRSVYDAGWGRFLDKLTYKAESAGRQLVRVNPNGTTQNCSVCSTRVPKTLSQRWHSCPSCGLSLSRDHNAALNILGAGLALASVTWPAGACVGAEVS